MGFPKELEEYTYDLPQELIAQRPCAERDASRLLAIIGERQEDRLISDLPELLAPGDLLVVNDSRVMAARCFLSRLTGGRVEVLFLSRGEGPVHALVRPSRRLREGENLLGNGGVSVRLLRRLGGGTWEVQGFPSNEAVMARIGRIPLPPYIRREDEPEDAERYQTIFARYQGSSAAPTAGLHFTQRLLARLEQAGIRLAAVTLHVGPGTFQPLREEQLISGFLHEEEYYIPPRTVEEIQRTRERAGRVIAVGTTVTRALESATPEGEVAPVPGPGTTRIFIREGYHFRTIQGILTNFHLPGTSLLMLVAAFLGRERLMQCYRHAISKRYRFYSYGDAMLILRG